MRARTALVAAAAAAALLTLAGAAAADEATLPGGTSIAVEIAAPLGGAILPEGPAAVSGTASVGAGLPLANTLLVYVLDLSGSTATGVSTSLCGNQNADGIPNRIIDCEIAAALALNDAAIGLGTVGEVAAVGFAGQTQPNGSLAAAFVLDLSPSVGLQNRIAPAADANGNSQRDLNEALSRVDSNGMIQLFTPASIGGWTNYWAAVHAARNVAATSSLPNKVVVFLSDGNSTSGGPSGEPVTAALVGISGITFHTFAIGNAAQCTPTVSNRGTLQQIADATGGTCTELDNPADAIGILPGVIASQLLAVSVRVDGGLPVPATVSPGVPATGPVSATWTAATGPLAPGAHEICATAKGSDAGGSGQAVDCVTVHVNAAPAVSAAGGTGAEGSAIPVSAAVTDDGAHSVAWSYVAGPGVDPGAACAFGDASAAATAVTCTDDGSFTVTATVDDGINPAVSSSALVDVSNADPTVAITAPGDGSSHPTAAPVVLATTTGDPGANDTVACTVDWGDGTIEPGCAGVHAYAAGGSYTITVTAADDDGGTASDSVTIQVNRPPSCDGVAPSLTELWPPNGKLVRVTLAGGSDPDGDAVSLTVTGVTQDEPPSAGGDARLPGGNAVDLRAKRLGTGDGRVYRIEYALSDQFGASCSGIATVGVPHDQRGAAAVDSGGSYDSL